MKSKMYVIKASSIMLIISMILLIVSNLYQFYCKNLLNIYPTIETILFGVITSSLVLLVSVFSEYRVAEIETLENYYIEMLKQIENFKVIDYLYIEEPIVLVKKCLSIYQNGEENKLFNSKEFKLFCKFLSYNIGNENFDSQRIDKDFKIYAKGRLNEIEKNVNLAVEKYIKFCDIDYRLAESLYGKIYYRKKNKFKNEIYNNLHDPIRIMRNKILRRSKTNFKYHFDSNESGYNVAVMINYIEELQKDLFEIDIDFKDVNDFSEVKVKTVSVKRKFYEEKSANLERYRSKIYKVEPDIIDAPYISTFTQIINNKQLKIINNEFSDREALEQI